MEEQHKEGAVAGTAGPGFSNLGKVMVLNIW